MANPRKISRLFSLDEVADALGISIKTVRRKIESGDLHAHRIGRQWRVSEDDYRVFVAARRV